MNRDYYKVSYTSNRMPTISDDVLDNVVDTEFNANQFKLFDDFTTDLRINFNSSSFRRRGDPNDSGVDMENGNPMDDSNDTDLLENEVMVDPWSSMDSSNSPLTDSVPSASDDCTPSTSSEPPRGSQEPSPLSPARRPLGSTHRTLPQTLPPKPDKARSRDLTLALDPDPLPRRPHFLDEDYQNPSKSNIECRIPKPHFLDHSPSPDEFDERSDITNPNFLDDEAEDDQTQKKAGALPKKTTKPSTYLPQEERPHRTSYRSTLHYGLESEARSSERDKRASQLYRGTWPGERDIWTGHDASSVRSFSSNGSADGHRPCSNLDNKMDCVISLISLLSLSPENNADLSGPLLEMSRSVESCIAMRQAGCIPLLVQLIHSKVPRETRDRAAKALRNIIHTQTDDKAGRREARVWRLLEQVREYCYILEDVVENRREGKEVIEDDGNKHPSQSVAALMKLSFDEEHRHVVCQLGGLQALAALVSGDQAAHGSRTDDNTCLTMRKYAGMTLTNLTFGDGNNKSLLCSFKDFMLALVEQLESPNDDMRQVTAAVLRNLSWRADTSSKQVLREVGAVKGLTKAAMTCQKEATLKSVLSALWNLTAHCSMNKVALCSVDGALGFLVDMLSYDSPTKTLAIVENAGGIMRNVSSHIAVREDYRQILRERNCLSVLLQHLKSPSLTVVSNSCGTLWNLSARCPLDQQFLWDHGAVPMLRSLIHSKHKMIAMGSGAALKNLLNSKPGKTHIISLDSTARTMNLPALPTLGARKQKALEQELDQNLAETCDNIEPATSPTTSNRDEKNLFTATERQIAMNLNRMSSSSPLMGALTSQISLSHSAHLASYLSCSNTLLKGALVTRSTTGSSSNVNRSDSKDSVTSAQSDTVFERVMRTGKVPVPTPRNKDLMKNETSGEAFKMASKPLAKDGFLRYPTQPPIPPPRTTDMRTNYTESGYDVDQDSCDQPIDFSRKYSETKTNEPDPSLAEGKPKPTKKYKKDSTSTFGDYQETDLDQPTDYSLRYAEHQSENGSDISEPAGPSVHEDTLKHFATEGTPYETPIIFSTATSMSDLRVIGKDGKPKSTPSVKENPEVMTHSDEKDTCSIEDPPRHDNDRAIITPQNPEPIPEKRSVFDTKFSSGMISPEKPVNYCDEGTPGYFSRVSSLSSLGEPTEEDSLAKKNAMATINVEPGVQDLNASSSKDKEGSKAVTFATDPVAVSSQPSTPGRFVEDTPLMFSRSSSLGSLPEADEQQDQGSVLSEVSRLTSGCISPSEIPDSPGAPASPRCADPVTPPPVCEPELDTRDCREVSVFEERTSQFMVENTPAQCSPPNLSSLSSLTIEEDIKPSQLSLKLSKEDMDTKNDGIDRSPAPQPLPVRTISEPLRGTQTPGDTCQVYFTEDTPAILSKAGSNSNLSVLSIESTPQQHHDTSDSSNLSDAHLLEDCIQKGIATAVKNKPLSDLSSVNYSDRDNVYRSLPPYLRASTETVKMSHEHERNVRVRTQTRKPAADKNCAQPRQAARRTIPPARSASTRSAPPTARSSRRPCAPACTRDTTRRAPSSGVRTTPDTPDDDFERNLASGIYNIKNNSRVRRLDQESLTRSPYSYHGESSSMAHRFRGHHSRYYDDGPPSLPARIDEPRRQLERSNSLSSLSNDSFGSTDKEVFERCVRMGMSKAQPKQRSENCECEATTERSGEDARTTKVKGRWTEWSARTPWTARCWRRLRGPRRTQPVNESYADVLDGSWSDEPRNYEVATLTRKKLEYTDIKYSDKAFEESKHDTWNDNTCPDDVTFPTISGSVHMVSSIRSEVADPALALPDLLEKSEPMMSTRPDLTNKLDEDTTSELHIPEDNPLSDVMLENIPEPSYTSLVDDGEQKFDSLMASAIEKEAARLAAQLKSSTYGMENSVTSLTSLDLDNVKPPSHLGSLLSLSASGQWDDTSKKSQKSRKKSLPVAMMVKRALSNSMHQGSSEHLDSNPVSFLDNVKPPSEMENLDMESSMISVSSIVSEVADREKTPVVFDFKQPIQDFPLCHNFNLLDLDKVNPPSLFDEMAESTVEIEPTTAHQLHDEVSSTLNVVTDIPSGSENCTPLPSDMSSVESTPKKTRDPKYLTPKEKRTVAKDRYQTYTIIDPPSESDMMTVASEEFVTWTKSESDRSDDYVTANSEAKSKRKMSAKQRRLEDRARYQTQTVNIQSIIQETKPVDPQIESLKQRLATKKTMKQKRMEDAERFRTRTLSEDIPPSPTFVTKDASFENVETTTGYDSLSSNELNHQQIMDDRQDDVFRETDSGHNEDDFELNSTQMQTYTKSFRNYLPVIESPSAVDICVVNNLKNIEMTASYRRALQSDKVQNPSSSDFASYEGDTHSDNDSEEEAAQRPKPKITKPERRDESLDSNDSHEKEEPKAVRGRKKAAYVSPYRRSVPPAKKPAAAPAKAPVKAIVPPKPSAKAPSKTPSTSKPPSANTSPKKTLNKSPSKIAQKAVAIPLVAGKPLPLERQGTFTKEESSVPAKNVPVPVAEKKPIVSRYAKTAPKPAVNNTSPSRLPQLNRYAKPPLKKGGSTERPAPKPKSAMRNSASNHSLQSNDSAKTVTLASRGSRQGSTSSVNSVQSSKINAKDVESKIASLWKKVEQTKKVIAKPDKRVWIESDKTEQPKLIRSSTFEGQPKQAQVSTAPKQKTAIGIKVSQIPSLRPKSTPPKATAPVAKKPVTARVFARKPANGQAT
ncbi:adenomatous polyposis coli protein-like [Leguminivora glycinivorella]|uniref:adenomatous polyposis coli protein-like n=1 Tax=Leguminivora glycinivorella TaxID=1035111 RepID=UPI00200FF385|nr:adenomatous polyposis coli protein-like [Leguminivora glycinivorella]